MLLTLVNIRLGQALHCLGYVKEKQGLFERSIRLYRRALANYEAIQGPKSFHGAQMNLKIAEYHSRNALCSADDSSKDVQQARYQQKPLGFPLLRITKYHSVLIFSWADPTLRRLSKYLSSSTTRTAAISTKRNSLGHCTYTLLSRPH